ncbi:hypothetical protein HYU92_03175 [Candidatus Curtissbacteria bacterium]|nr:hypothetical protein [Candidatus Curtissbacteria bacterium]
MNLKLLLAFPFATLVLLSELEGGKTFFGWHLFPLFPFLSILLAKAFYDLWQNPNLLKSLFFYLILGSSTVRFFLLLTLQSQKSWQWILGTLLVILIVGFFPKTAYRRIVLLAYFMVFFVVNVLVVINLNQIYPSYPQPLE